MWDFRFIDNDSGEDFFVECKSQREAWQIAWDVFGKDADLEYCERYTVEEAEAIGLDTY